MSTGTEIIEEALEEIGVHSVASPAAAQFIVRGVKILNSMLEQWLTNGIAIGFTPLDVAGDNLNEPLDTRNAIISNLAILMAPRADNGKVIVTQDLRTNAKVGFQSVKNLYQSVTIPEKGVSSTLPVGAGNMRGVNNRVFVKKDATVGN